MRLFSEMFISLYVIAMSLSGERETIKYAVTKYAAGFYRLSPLLSEGFCYFHLSGMLQCVRKKKGVRTNSIYNQPIKQ